MIKYWWKEDCNFLYYMLQCEQLCVRTSESGFYQWVWILAVGLDFTSGSGFCKWIWIWRPHGSDSLLYHLIYTQPWHTWCSPSDNYFMLHVANYYLQSSISVSHCSASSLPSWHCFTPSHIYTSRIHSPLPHLYVWSGQDMFREGLVMIILLVVAETNNNPSLSVVC